MTGKMKWFPILANGYWAEPDAFSYGDIHNHPVMSERDARAAIARAKLINSDQPIMSIS
jgi:hypothetical protein